MLRRLPGYDCVMGTTLLVALSSLFRFSGVVGEVGWIPYSFGLLDHGTTPVMLRRYDASK